ncbi:hypothetical protein [Nocardioides hungaricus]
MLLRTAAPATALIVLAALVSGCSGDGGGGDCTGATYDVDLSEQGAATPIDALNDWLAGPEELGEPPSEETWTLQDTGQKDPDEVVIRSEDGAGWWVQAVRTDGGGWVVSQATNDWKSCQDELS